MNTRVAFSSRASAVSVFYHMHLAKGLEPAEEFNVALNTTLIKCTVNIHRESCFIAL